MEQFNFKKFTKRGAKLGSYTISLNASHSFGFNSGFYNKEGIDKYKKVILYCDRERKAVAFQFTNEEGAEGAFTVIHGKGAGSVTCRSFIIENDINKEEYYGKKQPHLVKDEKFGELWVVNLDEQKKEE